MGFYASVFASVHEVHQASLVVRESEFPSVERFCVACEVNPHVVTAFIGGSFATGTADAYSDLEMLPPHLQEALVDAFSSLERKAMVKAARRVADLFQEAARSLAAQQEITYPDALEQVVLAWFDNESAKLDRQAPSNEAQTPD